MNFEQIIVQVGARGFSLGEVVLIFAGLLVLLFAGIALRSSMSARKRLRDVTQAHQNAEQLEARFLEMSGRLQTMTETNITSQNELARVLHERFDRMGHSVGQNLTNSTQQTSEGLAKLNERLAVIDTAQKELSKVSTQIVSLQDILTNKQARGAFGQSQMEAIINDGLPKTAFEFQPTLSNKTRPDCLIHLPNSPKGIVVDAKFPLEAFRDLPEQGKGSKEQNQRVRADITKHIKDIAEKYLIAGETQDMAIMFVPSEALYAQLHENFAALIQTAQRERVFIVSPNILMLAVHTMKAILKDARMREQADLIQNEVGLMIKDVHRLRDRTVNLQKHFGNATKDIEQILTSSDKISNRGLKIEAVEIEDEPIELEMPQPRNLLAGE